MSAQLDQTIALVTGATHGLGMEIARQLARRGMTVILTGRDLDTTDAAAEKLVSQNLDVIPAVVDVTSDDSVRRLASKVASNFGRLDVLVNHAAAEIDSHDTMTGADFEHVRSVMETNLFGTWRMIQTFLPLIRKSASGRIVNVANGAGSHGDPILGLTTQRGAKASYGIAEAALLAMTSKFGAELAGTGVLVNAVCPGPLGRTSSLEAGDGRSLSESAAGVVWAVALPENGPNGGFFRDGKTMPF